MLSLYVSYKDPLRFWMVLKNELDVTQFHNGMLVKQNDTLRKGFLNRTVETVFRAKDNWQCIHPHLAVSYSGECHGMISGNHYEVSNKWYHRFFATSARFKLYTLKTLATRTGSTSLVLFMTIVA